MSKLFSLIIALAVALTTFAFQLPSDMKIVKKPVFPFEISELAPAEVQTEKKKDHGFLWMSQYVPGTQNCDPSAEQVQILTPGGVCVPNTMGGDSKAPFAIHWVDGLTSDGFYQWVSGTYQEYNDANCRQAAGRVKKWRLPLGCFENTSGISWSPDRPQRPFGLVTETHSKQDCTGPSTAVSLQCNTCSNEDDTIGPSNLLACDVSQGSYQFVNFSGVNCTGVDEQPFNVPAPMCMKFRKYGMEMKMGGALRLQAPPRPSAP